MGSCDFRSGVLRMMPSNQAPVKTLNLEATVLVYVQDRIVLRLPGISRDAGCAVPLMAAFSVNLKIDMLDPKHPCGNNSGKSQRFQNYLSI